jgi:hypothetical protein
MFKRTNGILLALCLAASAVTAATAATAAAAAPAAESPFIGEWKLDPSKTRMPDEMKVESKGGNKYAFDFGGGAETIVADGTDQPGLDGPLLSAKADAPDTWIVQRKKDGRLLLRATWKLSSDGSTLTDYYREFESDGSTLSMDYVYQRTGPPAGPQTSNGSAFAADWQSIKETLNFPFVLQVKPFEGDGLSFITPSQKRTKSAKFDGKDYPDEGPNVQHGATSAIRRVDMRNLVLTDKYDGKVRATEEIGISADLKVLTITIRVPGRDKPNVMVFNRQ